MLLGFGLLLLSAGSIFADKSLPTKLNIESIVDDSSHSLPMPSEILAACQAQALLKHPDHHLEVLAMDLPKLARTSKLETAFVMGRMFAVIGLNLDQLSSENLVRLSERIHQGLRALNLPSAIARELEHQYENFVSAPELDRNELLMLFTESRSTLLQRLKEPGAVEDQDRRLLQALGVSLELGLWQQCLVTTLEQSKAEQLNEVAKIFFMPDVLEYFDSQLKIVRKDYPADSLLFLLHKIQEKVLKVEADKKFSQPEQEDLLQALHQLVRDA